MKNYAYATGMLINIVLIIGGVAYLTWMSTQTEIDIVRQSSIFSVMVEAVSWLLAVWVISKSFKKIPMKTKILWVATGVMLIIVGTQILSPLAGESYRHVGGMATKITLK
ncbi:MAG: hypothetical protein L3K25_07725 [Gammaproteobacteria bacterium]|nr:hypothetical protein [Gammaproteobacteria bacterium]